MEDGSNIGQGGPVDVQHSAFSVGDPSDPAVPRITVTDVGGGSWKIGGATGPAVDPADVQGYVQAVHEFENDAASAGDPLDLTKGLPSGAVITFNPNNPSIQYGSGQQVDLVLARGVCAGFINLGLASLPV